MTGRPHRQAAPGPRRMLRPVAIAAAASALGLAASSLPSAAEEGAQLVKTFKDWSVYAFAAPDKKICFATTQPKDTAPKGLSRGDAFFYVSFFPLESVVNEVSVKLGYPIKSGSPIVVSIGGAETKLFAKDDRAYVESPEVEKELVAALKKGDKLVVKATSAKGTATTDVYSLLGVSSALKEAEQSCK